MNLQIVIFATKIQKHVVTIIENALGLAIIRI